jgi:hypothetical protein
VLRVYKPRRNLKQRNLSQRVGRNANDLNPAKEQAARLPREHTTTRAAHRGDSEVLLIRSIVQLHQRPLPKERFRMSINRLGLQSKQPR